MKHVADPAGTVDLSVNIRLTDEDLRTWEPARLTALLDGIAKIRAAAHEGDTIEQLKIDWRAADETTRHMERCLEDLAKNVGIDPDAPEFEGELWAAKLTAAISRRVTLGAEA